MKQAGTVLRQAQGKFHPTRLLSHLCLIRLINMVSLVSAGLVLVSFFFLVDLV